MIPLIKEPDDLEWNISEVCFFCKRPTKYWHKDTNNPVCPECAERHQVKELPDHRYLIREKKRKEKGKLSVSNERPTWHELFMAAAQLIAKRSTCLSRQVGAVVTKDNHILCSGYNGAPSGLPHCSETGCLRQQLKVPSGEKHELCRGVHAEQNVIIQAAYHGVSIKGGILYCTHQPCSICIKMIVNVGIIRVYYLQPYNDSLAAKLGAAANLDCFQLTL